MFFKHLLYDSSASTSKAKEKIHQKRKKKSEQDLQSNDYSDKVYG